MAKSGWYRSNAMNIDIRLDIDGDNPQNYLSFTYGATVHDIGPLTSLGNDTWETTSLQHKGSQMINGLTKVKVQYVNETLQTQLLKADGSSIWSGPVARKSTYFREVELEFDYENGINQIMSFNPYQSGDNFRAPSLPNEAITVASTFGKAGIKVNESVNANAVATAGAGGNSKWSDNELHDAMQVQWSKTEAAQWAVWVFQANQHDNDMTGVMFDSIGSFQRCGVAMFHGYSGYPGLPAGTVNRHKFHTLIHEMGHSFNLYHSWVKTSGTSTWDNSVVNEPEARSYMNYPDKVAAGYYGFFDTFEYRFSDQELKFLRHAPVGMVQPGGSAWGTDHAGATIDGPQSGMSSENGLQLVVSSNKATPAYEYLELVNLELKLKNVSDTAQKVPEGILGDLAHMHIRISRNGQPLKEFKPYATPCAKDDPAVTLQPGEAIYDSFFLSSGKFGWAVSEPGVYQVSVCLHSHTEDGDMDITSEPFMFTVAEPDRFNRQKRKEQEALAQDVFTDDVGRTLAFNGTQVLTGANEVLQELAERFPEAKAAVHAKVALAMPHTQDGYKVMTVNADGSKGITPKKANPKEGVEVMKKVLVENGEKAAETMGNVAFQKVSEKAARHLKAQGNDAGAKELRQNVLTTMEKRGVKLPEKVKKDLENKVKG